MTLAPNMHSKPLAWWKKATAYQIYPRSFYDTNQDGIGDINGIIAKLDYLADLGIDLIWICPFYASPNDDNGYDISDYQAIHPDFGTLEDVDELISAAHKRGIRIIMDLVINHTSDEHPWFIESRDNKNSPKRDWYIWRDGCEPTAEKPTCDPNNWESIFHDSAWEYDKKTAQYYLHLFSKKQPDLNWENPEVKQTLFKMIYWWLERGIDGFRVDAISHIQKQPGLPSLPNPKGEKYASSFDYHMNVAGIEKHLHELKEQAFDPFNIVTVGEANGVTADNALLWVAEATEHDQGGVFNMIFQFEHMKLWSEEQSNVPLDLVEFKRILSRWQDALEGKGWNALYLENHDQARSIDTFADPTSRYASATALASCYFLMKGTPFIYQGQEIGMVNHQFTSLDEFNDVSARNLIQKLSQQGQSDADILALLNQVSRDHSRLPMQWNAQDFAGFSEVQPWFSVNQQYADINVEQQQNDPNSILSFYKQLIALRKSNVSLVVGRYQLLLPNDPNIYAYQRVAQDMTWTIITNLSPQESIVDIDRMQLGELMLDNQNINNEHVRSDFIATQIAPPYAAYIFARKH
ncbi:TPA: alpha-glucosidase [Enterobacter asburiae]|uniref:glycoside hydrolase family 13 protein n=1 Tax=Enterobacter asburiae TaxID=61645 RepID=UPI0021634B0B|nr:alpha-glucosidase [Enterobacter asburiae]MCS0623827.1 alpha-glucosidase [Enterobacter asburiae]HDR2366141.1 alpha-glucosidase [Enterobacter asburiae]